MESGAFPDELDGHAPDLCLSEFSSSLAGSLSLRLPLGIFGAHITEHTLSRTAFDWACVEDPAILWKSFPRRPSACHMPKHALIENARAAGVWPLISCSSARSNSFYSECVDLFVLLTKISLMRSQWNSGPWCFGKCVTRVPDVVANCFFWVRFHILYKSLDLNSKIFFTHVSRWQKLARAGIRKFGLCWQITSLWDMQIILWLSRLRMVYRQKLAVKYVSLANSVWK